MVVQTCNSVTRHAEVGRGWDTNQPGRLGKERGNKKNSGFPRAKRTHSHLNIGMLFQRMFWNLLFALFKRECENHKVLALMNQGT